MVNKDHAEVLEEITELVKNKKYNTAIYYVIYYLFPSVEPDKGAICDNRSLIAYLTKLYETELPKTLLHVPFVKATYLITLATILNNKANLLYIPEDIKTVRVCINLEKISLAYLRKAILLLNTHSIQLPFERVNELNYMFNVIDLNIAITLMSDKGKMFTDQEVQKRFQVVQGRLTALISRDPKPEYSKLKSLVMHYLGDEASARIASRESVQTIHLKDNIMNLEKLKYRKKYAGKLHPVVIYE